MNRIAKRCRMGGGLLLIGNIILFFLPVLTITQENYPTEQYTLYSYLCRVFRQNSGYGAPSFTVSSSVIVLLVLVPAMLSLTFGVIGIIGIFRQVVPAIGAAIVLVFQIACYSQLSQMAPEKRNSEQIYSSGCGKWLLIFPIAACICEWIGVYMNLKRYNKYTKTQIATTYYETNFQHSDVPVTPMYEFVDETVAVFQNVTSNSDMETLALVPDDKPKHGVMIGLSGTYQGAKIPFGENETLRLGRDRTNDLVFADAPKVSRVHCAITWLAAEQKYKILDTSTNGCFINAMEECIPQNIELYLEPGTVLDVGDPTNRFRLD